MKKSKELEKSMNVLRNSILPKTLNLRSMVIEAVEVKSDPEYARFNDDSKLLVSERIKYEFVLKDFANNITATIIVEKQIQHN